METSNVGSSAPEVEETRNTMFKAYIEMAKMKMKMRMKVKEGKDELACFVFWSEVRHHWPRQPRLQLIKP